MYTKYGPAAKCRGVDLRPAVSRALTVFGVTSFLTRARSPVLQASKSSRSGSCWPGATATTPVAPVPPLAALVLLPLAPGTPAPRVSALVNTDRRPAISHRHFHARRLLLYVRCSRSRRAVIPAALAISSHAVLPHAHGVCLYHCLLYYL